jgi:hypothetical protein
MVSRGLVGRDAGAGGKVGHRFDAALWIEDVTEFAVEGPSGTEPRRHSAVCHAGRSVAGDEDCGINVLVAVFRQVFPAAEGAAGKPGDGNP